MRGQLLRGEDNYRYATNNRRGQLPRGRGKLMKCRATTERRGHLPIGEANYREARAIGENN